jgi:hypothetical protein
VDDFMRDFLPLKVSSKGYHDFLDDRKLLIELELFAIGSPQVEIEFSCQVISKEWTQPRMN